MMILTWASVAVIVSWPPSGTGQFTPTLPIPLVGISNCHQWAIIVVVTHQWLKAKTYMYSKPPDFENSIKESINSVESALKILTGNSRSTLGQLVKGIDIDPDIRRILSQVYGLLSNKAFVRHGGTQAEYIGEEEAEFFLELAATSIVYLKRKLRR
jgi:hypothetical protein